MTLSNDQLGRIARAANNYGMYTHYDVLRCAVAGDLASALAIVGSLEGDWRDNPLLSVLREVAEEVERKASKCLLEIENGAYPLSRLVDGATVLDAARGSVACLDVSGRVRISNEAHGVAWTWERP